MFELDGIQCSCSKASILKHLLAFCITWCIVWSFVLNFRIFHTVSFVQIRTWPDAGYDHVCGWHPKMTIHRINSVVVNKMRWKVTCWMCCIAGGGFVKCLYWSKPYSIRRHAWWCVMDTSHMLWSRSYHIPNADKVHRGFDSNRFPWIFDAVPQLVGKIWRNARGDTFSATCTACLQILESIWVEMTRAQVAKQLTIRRAALGKKVGHKKWQDKPWFKTRKACSKNVHRNSQILPWESRTRGLPKFSNFLVLGNPT